MQLNMLKAQNTNINQGTWSPLLNVGVAHNGNCLRLPTNIHQSSYQGFPMFFREVIFCRKTR